MKSDITTIIVNKVKGDIMWIKKKLFCMLLLLLLHFCYAQQSQLVFTNTNTTDLFQNIDNSLNFIEQNQNNMKILIDEQEKQIASLENAYQNQLQLYLDLDNKYQKSEQDTKKWKNCCLVMGGTTLTLAISTTVLLMILAGK